MTLRLEVFDPALCCPTGVCGPSVDPALARFAGDLARLRREGVTIERHNLSHDPGAFAGNDLVRGEIERRGVACLPVVVANGRLLGVGRYPDRAELRAAFGLGGPVSVPAPGSCGGGTSPASTGGCGE